MEKEVNSIEIPQVRYECKSCVEMRHVVCIDRAENLRYVNYGAGVGWVCEICFDLRSYDAGIYCTDEEHYAVWNRSPILAGYVGPETIPSSFYECAMCTEVADDFADENYCNSSNLRYVDYGYDIDWICYDCYERESQEYNIDKGRNESLEDFFMKWKEATVLENEIRKLSTN